MKLPSSIQKLADILSELPSIGPRQAIRLSFYLISKGDKNISELIGELEDLKNLKACERCFFPTTGTLCEICSDPNRDPKVIMVLEKETDLLSIENTGKYHGRYLVLGHIPRTGLLENGQRKRLDVLKNFVQKELEGQAREIILATNPTSTGDFHAGLLIKELSPLTKKISRLGRGLPTGGEIEFADDETLSSSLQSRS